MLVTLDGIVTLVRLVQLANAYSPIPFTLDGIVTLFKLEQPQNAEAPMFITLDGIVTLVRLVKELKNAKSPILVTPL